MESRTSRFARPRRPAWPRAGCDRRAFLAGCGALGGLALARPLRAAMPPADGLAFDILREGGRIGRHTVTFRRDAARLEVDIAIDIEVRLAFLTLFRYRHRNRELWQDGRLIGLDSSTDDNGTDHRVRARAGADGLRVEADGAVYWAPRDILPTSYWHPRTPAQSRLLDTQKGRLLTVDVAPLGREILPLAGGEVAALRYAMSGDLALDLWYAPDGRWLKVAFEARGARVDYRPLTAIGSGNAEAPRA
jgi:hypothetical protein